MSLPLPGASLRCRRSQPAVLLPRRRARQVLHPPATTTVRRSTSTTPEWGDGGIGNYFYWKAAHRAAWKHPSPGIVAFRIRKAERLGLTYEEYTLEILERGRHLQVEDVERISEIKRRRDAHAVNHRK